MDIDSLRRRWWLINNTEWLMTEVVFHREYRYFINDKKIKIWRLGDKEGCATIQ